MGSREIGSRQSRGRGSAVGRSAVGSREVGDRQSGDRESAVGIGSREVGNRQSGGRESAVGRSGVGSRDRESGIGSREIGRSGVGNRQSGDRVCGLLCFLLFCFSAFLLLCSYASAFFAPSARQGKSHHANVSSARVAPEDGGRVWDSWTRRRARGGARRGASTSTNTDRDRCLKPARAQSASLRAQSDAGHFPVHERWTVACRYL